jgi:hypothetical protein
MTIQVAVYLGIVALTSLFASVWLWFMIARPEQWGRLVDKENDFWLRLGILPQWLIQHTRRFEKGRGQRILVGCGAVLNGAGFVGFSIAAWIILRRHTH